MGIVVVVGAVAILAALPACSGPPESGATTARRTGLPALPPTPTQALGAAQPPVIWVGGSLDDVAAERMVLREPSGSLITLQRLAEGATKFYRVSGDAWLELAQEAQVRAGQPACVETLMDGANLLALRVFLGAACGPR